MGSKSWSTKNEPRTGKFDISKGKIVVGEVRWRFTTGLKWLQGKQNQRKTKAASQKEDSFQKDQESEPERTVKPQKGNEKVE